MTQRSYPTVIKFFIREESYGWLSNFERTPFEVDGVLYPNNETYYQSEKANNHIMNLYIRNAPNATVAMVLGRQLEHNKYLQKHMTADWDSKKKDVMLKGLRHKFQNPLLKKQLLSTGDAILHEDNPEDFYWAIADGTGESWLGRLLMQVRDELRLSPTITEKEADVVE